MTEESKTALKVPLLLLPDRALEKQTEIHVVIHQKSGKTYMIPLLILPKSIATANSESSGTSCNRYEDTVSEAYDPDSSFNGKREKLCTGNKTCKLTDIVDGFHLKHLRTPTGR